MQRKTESYRLLEAERFGFRCVDQGRYRDLKHLIPFLVQFGVYATPVAYPARLVPEQYLFLYNLNPMVGIIEGFRWCVFGGNPPTGYFYMAAGIVVVLFISGLLYFKRVERVMADIV